MKLLFLFIFLIPNLLLAKEARVSASVSAYIMPHDINVIDCGGVLVVVPDFLKTSFSEEDKINYKELCEIYKKTWLVHDVKMASMKSTNSKEAAKPWIDLANYLIKNKDSFNRADDCLCIAQKIMETK